MMKTLALFILATCLYAAAAAQEPRRELQGTWQIVSYRFGDGISVGPRDAKRFVGRKILLSAKRAVSGREVCAQPTFESKRMDGDQFATEFRTSLKSIGISAKDVELVEVQCGGSDWLVPGSTLIISKGETISKGQTLTMWDGVFFVLKKR